MNQLVRTFKLGNSTVVTLPKKLGIRPGQHLRIKKYKEKIELSPAGGNKSDVVNKLAGKLRLKHHSTPDEINKIIDEQYEDVLS